MFINCYEFLNTLKSKLNSPNFYTQLTGHD